MATSWEQENFKEIRYMRKKIISIGIIAVMSLMTFVGCGKSEEEKTAEQLGISTEEYKDMNEAVTEYLEDESEAFEEHLKEAKQSETEEAQLPKYEAKEEIVNADFRDFKFQLDDTIFVVTLGETLENFMSQFDEDKYSWCDSDHKEINLNKLVTNQDYYEDVYLVNKNDSQKFILGINVRNEGIETCELSQAVLYSFNLSKKYKGSIYFPKGIPYDIELLQSDSNFSYENIAAYLDSFGFESDNQTDNRWMEKEDCGKVIIGKDDTGMTYTITAFGDESEYLVSERITMGEQKMVDRPYYVIRFEIDPETRACKDVSFTYINANNWEYIN